MGTSDLGGRDLGDEAAEESLGRGERMEQWREGRRSAGMLKVMLLRVAAVALLLGGAVRIFATRALFQTFGIGALWMQAPYSIYIYRVLGGFVTLSGILLLIISGDPGKYRRLLKGHALGFAMIGVVMVAAGLISGLPPRHYLPDPVYCFIIAALSWHSGR